MTETSYHYRNGDVVVRRDGDGGKSFLTQHIDPVTGEVKSGKSVQPTCLYREEEIEARPDEPVYFVEGEKCVEFLRKKGFLATTSIHGASSYEKSRPAAVRLLRGRKVIILADNDEPGRNYAEEVARSLRDKASSVRVVLTGQEKGDDIVDFFERGGSVEGLADLVEASAELATYRPLGRSVCEFLGEPFDDDPDGPSYWVCPGVVPSGALTILGGPPKVGKTFVALDMGIAVSHGKKFLSTFPVHTGKVLLILEEDPIHVSRRRLRAMFNGREISPSDTLRIAPMSGLRLDSKEGFERLVREVEFFRPRLVITDALSRVHGLDENSKTDMMKVMYPIHRLCAENDVAMVMLHHVRKLPVGIERPGIVQLLRGSSDLPGQARAIVGVFREGNDLLEFDIDGNNDMIDPFIAKMNSRTEDGVEKIGFQVLGPKHTASSEAAIPEIEGFLRECVTPALASEIRMCVNRKQDTIIHALRLMETRGIAKKSGKGWMLNG